MTAGARLPRRKGFEAARPPDVSDARWQAALRGLQAFVARGWGQKAEALGWTRDELFAVPKLWSRIHLTGVALLIADNEVTAVTPTEIRIKTASGANQGFYRKPAADYGVVYRSHLLRGRCETDAGNQEAHLRAVEHAVNLACSHGLGPEEAKRAVLAAIREIA
jgi:hypothetical protein